MLDLGFRFRCSVPDLGFRFMRSVPDLGFSYTISYVCVLVASSSSSSSSSAFPRVIDILVRNDSPSFPAFKCPVIASLFSVLANVKGLHFMNESRNTWKYYVCETLTLLHLFHSLEERGKDRLTETRRYRGMQRERERKRERERGGERERASGE